MAMFKGIPPLDLLREDPRVLCGILSAELARTNEALEGMSEELKVMQKRRVVLEDRVAALQGQAGVLASEPGTQGQA